MNLHLTVIRKLAREAAANGILAPAIAAAVAGVKGARQKGRRLGTWLNLEQTQALLKAPACDRRGIAPCSASWSVAACGAANSPA